MVLNEREARLDADDQASRMERLITAIEALTNMLGRFVGFFEARRPRAGTQASPRLRRAVADKPIKITPVAEAAVKRALARLRR